MRKFFYVNLLVFAALLFGCAKSFANILPANPAPFDFIFENGTPDPTDSIFNFAQPDKFISPEGNPTALSPQATCRSFITSTPDCVSKTLKLTAFIEITNPPAAPQILPFTGLWSNGQVAQSIQVVPPGAWSIETPGCAFPNDNAFFADTKSFFQGPLTIDGPTVLCTGPILVTAGNGYNFNSFNWFPANPHSVISPYEISMPGSYALIANDQYDCQFVAWKTVTQSPPVLPVVSGTKSLCIGQSGNLTVNPPASQYLWESGETTQSISVDVAGLYTVTVTNQFGCTGMAFFNVLESPEISEIFGFVSPPQICPGGTAIVLANIGGAGTFIWSTGATSPNISVSDPGDYSVTATNGFGCSRSESFTVVAAIPPVPVLNSPAICPGFSATLTVSGGDFNMFTWSTGQNSPTITVNTAGTYSVIVRDANGCKGTATATVTASPAAVPTVSVAQYACNGQMSLSANGGFTSYLWSNGQTTQNISAQTNGNYSVTVVNSAGCTGVASQNVNIPPAPATNISGVTTLCANVSGQLSATGGYPIYAWSNGQTGANITATAAGNYTVTATDGFGCTATAQHTINLSPALQPGIAGPLQICANTTVTLSAVGNFGSYFWSNNQSTPSIQISAAGNYALTVTNPDGCTGTAAQTVNFATGIPPQVVAIQNVSCFQGNNGMALATGNGGNGTFNYQWSNGATTPTASNLSAGTYSVVVTDGNGCTASSSIAISQPPVLLLNAAATAETFNNGNNGTAAATAAGGTQGYNFSWSNGATGANISGLAPGSYIVTATDANGCTTSQTVFVNQYNCTFSGFSQNTTNVSCFGQNDGTATIIASGGVAPIIYNWSNGGSGETISNLAPGQYTVNILDATECPAEFDFTITEPSLLVAATTSTNATGNNSNNGTASATATGGTAGYTFLWSNGQTTATIQNLAAGFYTVTATDLNGCTAVSVVEVGLDCALTASINLTQPTCFGLANGSVSLDVLGGVTPLNFIWTDGTNPVNPTALPAGNYFVTATDANGCEITATATLGQPNQLLISTTSTTPTSCVSDSTGAATVSASGGTGNINFSWENGQSGATATGLGAGQISVVATDQNGCETTSEITILVSDLVPPVISVSNLVLPLGPAGSVVLTPLNTNSTFSDNCLLQAFSFSPASFNCTQQGEHVVTASATDASNNTATAQFSITIIDNLAPVMDCPDNIVRCFGDDVVSYNAPSVEDNCQTTGGQFSFDSGLPSGSQFPVGVTANAYSFTDAAGNVGACSFTVTILEQLTISAPVVVNDIDNKMVGSINITVTGGQQPYTFTWKKNGQPFATTEDLTNIGSGAYTIQIVDSLGCTVAAQAFEVQNVVATNEPAWGSKFQLLPNPTTGLLTANFPTDLSGEAAALVFDATGRLVFSRNFKMEEKIRFDLTDLADGFYTVSIRLNGEMVNRKVVVERN